MTVIKIIEEAAEEMCDNYCKMPEEYKKKHLDLPFDDWSDELYEKFQEEICSNCPLNKLY